MSNKWRRLTLLLSACMLVMSSSVILMGHLSSSLHSSDFIKGIGMGVLIGLPLLALVKAKKQQYTNRPKG